MSHISLRCTQCEAGHTADMATCIAAAAMRRWRWSTPIHPRTLHCLSRRGWLGTAIPLPIHNTDASMSLPRAHALRRAAFVGRSDGSSTPFRQAGVPESDRLFQGTGARG